MSLLALRLPRFSVRGTKTHPGYRRPKRKDLRPGAQIFIVDCKFDRLSPFRLIVLADQPIVVIDGVEMVHGERQNAGFGIDGTIDTLFPVLVTERDQLIPVSEVVRADPTHTQYWLPLSS